MARLHPLDPELRKRAKLAKSTPDVDLQLRNLPIEDTEQAERDEESYPRYDLMLEYWEGE